jgi:WD40 repeat protein
MRADSLAGQVIAVVSRRTPALEPRPGEPSTFPGRIYQASPRHARILALASRPAGSGAGRPAGTPGPDVIEFMPRGWPFASGSRGAQGSLDRRYLWPFMYAALAVVTVLVALTLLLPSGGAPSPAPGLLNDSVTAVLGPAQPLGKGNVAAFAFATASSTPDIAVANSDAGTSVSLWNAVTGHLAATLSSGTDVAALAFSPNGKTLAVGSANASTYLWDAATRRVVATLSSGADVAALAFSPNGKTLAVGSDNGVQLWDVATRQPMTTLLDPSAETATAVAFSPDGKTLALADADGVQLWQVADMRPITTTPLAAPSGQVVTAVAFSPDSKTLALADANGVQLWDVATRQPIATLADPASQGVTTPAFTPDGKTLAVGDNNGVQLWDVATRQPITTLADPASQGVTAVAFTPDGKTLTVGDNNGRAYLWSVRTP